VQGASGAVAAVGLGLLLAAFVDQHSDGAAEWRSLAALHDHHQASAAGLPPPPSPLSPGFAALVLGAVLLAPATEELLFRGYLLPSLAGLGLPLPAAVALDAAAFAAVHPAEGGAAGYAAEALLGALLAGAAVAGGGNLAVPLVAHAGYNAIVLLLGSSVSAAAS
jgi:membrane protease YdiL (CAAX protease family)